MRIVATTVISGHALVGVGPRYLQMRHVALSSALKMASNNFSRRQAEFGYQRTEQVMQLNFSDIGAWHSGLKDLFGTVPASYLPYISDTTWHGEF